MLQMRFFLVLLLVSSAGCASKHADTDTVEFDVPDMMCPDGCAVAVKEILARQPGAKDVKVDFDSKTAIVAVDRDSFDADRALAALVDHQFNHSALKTGDKTGAFATPSAEAVPVQ